MQLFVLCNPSYIIFIETLTYKPLKTSVKYQAYKKIPPEFSTPLTFSYKRWYNVEKCWQNWYVCNT